ncbi:SOS response-associated peptidase [Frigoribacterium endophyticum]|uniref:SOS response-associated peptidase n=1 Tax=Frigoribacterium endophyticum TaxID=1522176 RepID=UPI0014235C7D|nr:SOS response-associated peptidase [Frigoribacterium endophyticum]NII50496.1 putative SOS response-associated peptidase YedK [Frigoribacterium endophyticum]
MCGRFVMARASSDLVALFDVDVSGDTLPDPSWNIAPTRPVSLLVDAAPRGDDAGGPPVRRLASARWGFVAAGSPGPVGAPLFNARVETAAEKPTFREAVASRRGLVPANGWYEWQVRPDGSKRPVYVSLPDDEVMLFAALYEWWRDPAAAVGSPSRWLLSTAVLTRASSGPFAEVHDRMPVLVGADVMDDWLDPETEGDDDLLQGVSGLVDEVAARLQVHEVSPEVGRVGVDSPSLVDPV